MSAALVPALVDSAIAAAWPDRWSKANDPARRGRSKARNNLRKAWRYHVELQDLKARQPTACCRTCDNFKPRHMHPVQFICLVDSDFHGDLVVQADHLCVLWRGRELQREASQ